MAANKQRPQPPATRTFVRRAIVIVVAVAVAATILVSLLTQTTNPTRKEDAAPVSYTVGAPGPGVEAPAFSLPSTAGGTVNLSDYRGKSVMLFFHEGIGCQPCWDQIRDLESAQAQLKSAGIDQVLTITSGPVELIAQKMADDKLTAVALADTQLDVSVTYQTNKYGMMGDSRNGHSFILVGPRGKFSGGPTTAGRRTTRCMCPSIR
ncbi:redoxin domain-containing protein [Cryobacterium sp. TMT1-21]|uniref:Redoxin domain-containing protein n=1 Tax=Cryobacterium shii TaxID=1259235 RepID=A0AAQ2C3F2_9MICO|nr:MULTISPECIES: redoxin domain-containing protein [Cryobacterium]TFC41778.1 redoxin domain-containing protein [Cryobacterium shii]TFC84471.1 redoxin domain-containing protein [Cryobacterium sp. TmT2-59]TFD15381.1 redoxin domain-containing protein [Cryobacterium sp. TMT4-10]TFD17539.1 redoxin domain-containing protein [Cryobacterium sp. TMT1-21]TFD22012.1 redoxin domain-containing protein [Cryobacterium sp. TMT2-23]